MCIRDRFLYGPILVLVLYSFNAAHLSMAWRGTTLKWYAALWHDEALLAATANSLLIAVISTIGATLLGGLMALGMERMPLRRQQIIEGGLVLPLVIPEVMMGVALMLLFVMLKMPLGLTTVILGHIVFNIPLMTIMTVSYTHLDVYKRQAPVCTKPIALPFTM